MEMTIGNEFSELARVADAIEEFAKREGIRAAVMDGVNLAVDELLTNTMMYGYPAEAKDSIGIQAYREAGQLVVIITDRGKGFDPRGKRERKHASSIEDCKIGGLGLFFVQEMTDGLEYRHSEGRNITTIRKEVGEEVVRDTTGQEGSEDENA